MKDSQLLATIRQLQQRNVFVTGFRMNACTFGALKRMGTVDGHGRIIGRDVYVEPRIPDKEIRIETSVALEAVILAD